MSHLAHAEYYLHENGSLICKPNGGVDIMSPFVKGLWQGTVIGKSPEAFVTFLEQAHKKGANREDICRLADHNNLQKYQPAWKSRVFGKEQSNGQA